jgi:hypothetical protein
MIENHAVRLVWSDECDGGAWASPDPSLWGVRESDEWQPLAELQTYTGDMTTPTTTPNGVWS